VEKSSPIICAIFTIFPKATQSKQLPKRRKFVQSGQHFLFGKRSRILPRPGSNWKSVLSRVTRRVLWKNGPKCSPARFFAKINMTSTSWKRSSQKICSTWVIWVIFLAIAHWTKMNPNWSPCSCQANFISTNSCLRNARKDTSIKQRDCQCFQRAINRDRKRAINRDTQKESNKLR
jgi:hypothetical protein